MLIYSMSVSVDGFIADREGAFAWSGGPSEEQFRFHVTQTRELGGFLLGRRLYEMMLVWETDPSMRHSELDGRDAEPDAERRTDVGMKCRLYRSASGVSGQPPQEWLRAAIAGGAGAPA